MSSPSKPRSSARITTGGRAPCKGDPPAEGTVAMQQVLGHGPSVASDAGDPAVSPPAPSLGKRVHNADGEDVDIAPPGSGAPSPTKKSRSDGNEGSGTPATQGTSAGVAARLFAAMPPAGDPAPHGSDTTALPYDVDAMPRVALSVFNDRQRRTAWASQWRDGKSLVRTTVARPDLCGVTLKDDFDVVLKEKGLYNDLPFLPAFQSTGYGNVPHDLPIDDISGRPIVPSVDMSVWEPYKLDDGYIESIVSYVSSKDRSIVNPARDDPVHFAAKETWSKDWNGTSFALVNRATLEPVTLVTLGVCMSSNIVTPRSGDKGPTYKALQILGHRVEHERQMAFLCTVFQEDSLHMQVSRANNVVTYQTKFMPTKAQGSSTSYLPTKQIGGLTLASSPTKKSVSSTPQPKWNGGYEWSAQIPIYDSRSSNFDMDNVEHSLNSLRESGSLWSPGDEVDLGACVLVGYGAHSNYWSNNWRCSLYIKWAVVLAA